MAKRYEMKKDSCLVFVEKSKMASFEKKGFKKTGKEWAPKAPVAPKK